MGCIDSKDSNYLPKTDNHIARTEGNNSNIDSHSENDVKSDNTKVKNDTGVDSNDNSHNYLPNVPFVQSNDKLEYYGSTNNTPDNTRTPADRFLTYKNIIHSPNILEPTPISSRAFCNLVDEKHECINGISENEALKSEQTKEQEGFDLQFHNLVGFSSREDSLSTNLSSVSDDENTNTKTNASKESPMDSSFMFNINRFRGLSRPQADYRMPHVVTDDDSSHGYSEPARANKLSKLSKASVLRYS